MAPHARVPASKPINPLFIVGGIAIAVVLCSSCMSASGLISGINTVFSAPTAPPSTAPTGIPVITFAPTARPSQAPKKASNKPFAHGNVVGI